ncbi:MAG: FliO/MopB family protein [Acidimicrobiales bacterium]
MPLISPLLMILGATASSSPVALGSVLLRLVVSLGVIAALIWVLAQYVKRRGLPGITRPGGAKRSPSRPPGRAGNSIEVVARQTLGKGLAVVAVKLGPTVVLLGVTPSTITRLGECEPGEIEVARPNLTTIKNINTNQGSDHRVATFLEGMNRSTARVRPTRTNPPTWMSKIDQLRDRTTRRA